MTVPRKRANDMKATRIDEIDVSVGVYGPRPARTIESHDDASTHNNNNRLERNWRTVLTRGVALLVG